MKLIDRIKALSASIGNDIKAIKDKTNLLKTAAYKDVGTTDGNIPEFVGVNGIGGLGYGGEAKRLDAGSDLNLLPRINAIYTATKDDNILNRPIELVNYIFKHEFVIECIVGNTVGAYGTYIQRLTFDAFPPEGTSTTNPVVFIRSYSYLGFSSWVRLTGKIYGVDVGGEVIGDDLVVNSIKAGATSPKIAFEKIRVDFTYENFGYAPDGITALYPDIDTRGYTHVIPTPKPKNIMFSNVSIYADFYGTIQIQAAEYTGTGAYFVLQNLGNELFIRTSTEAHAMAQYGDKSKSGQNLFDKNAYAELFIIYKVD